MAAGTKRASIIEVLKTKGAGPADTMAPSIINKGREILWLLLQRLKEYSKGKRKGRVLGDRREGRNVKSSVQLRRK